MIAVVLAGGKGTRLRETGRMIPKPLIPMGDRPVINELIDRLLAVDKRSVRKVFVLAKKRQRLAETKYDRQRAVETEDAWRGWKDVWYGKASADRERVRLVFDDELPRAPRGTGQKKGALLGLYRFFRFAEKEQLLPAEDRVLVAAGDNYFQDSLERFVQEGKRHPNATVIACKDLRDPQRIRHKYGCVSMDDAGWVTGFREKPRDPKPHETRASLGLYSFPCRDFLLLKGYVKSPRTRLEGPGHFIHWLVRRHKLGDHVDAPRRLDDARGVRAVEVEHDWSDIGNRTDLKICVFKYLNEMIGRFETVEHLIIARETGKLDDQHSLLCWDIEVDGAARRIILRFTLGDRICKASGAVSGKSTTVDEVRGAARANPALWDELRGALRSAKCRRFVLRKPERPLLLSGGVFLFDACEVGGRLPRRRALVPLLEMDAEARIAPRRHTMPAGPMDMLDLAEVCFGELNEEFVFYGRERPEDHTRIFCCEPVYKEFRESSFARLLRNRIAVPGLDDRKVEAFREGDRRAVDALVKSVRLNVLQLPAEKSWEVVVRLDGKSVYESPGFIVIPDPAYATLEFRLVCYADLTDFPLNATVSEETVDTELGRVGRLMGIADGEGLDRRSYLVRADKIEEYYRRLKSTRQSSIRQALTTSETNPMKVLAIGQGGTGRFSKFGADLPPLCFTTSVRYLMDLLDTVLA